MTKQATPHSRFLFLSLLMLLTSAAFGCSSDDDDGGGATAGAGGGSGSGGAGGEGGADDAGTDASTGSSGEGGSGGGGTGGASGTAGGAGGIGGTSAGALLLSSEAFDDGGALPSKHRCVSLGGDSGPSPQLSWSGVPDDTESFAVTVTDKSSGIGAGYAHWTIYDIPASESELAEGIMRAALPDEPAGAKQSANQNSFVPGPGYFGPCGMSENPYEFRVYALDVAELPGVSETSSVGEVRSAIDAHTIESAAITAFSGP